MNSRPWWHACAVVSPRNRNEAEARLVSRRHGGRDAAGVDFSGTRRFRRLVASGLAHESRRGADFLSARRGAFLCGAESGDLALAAAPRGAVRYLSAFSFARTRTQRGARRSFSD